MTCRLIDGTPASREDKLDGKREEATWVSERDTAVYKLHICFRPPTKERLRGRKTDNGVFQC